MRLTIVLCSLLAASFFVSAAFTRRTARLPGVSSVTWVLALPTDAAGSDAGYQEGANEGAPDAFGKILSPFTSSRALVQLVTLRASVTQ